MKNESLTPEQQADRTLESLDGITRAEVPAGLEEKLFARLVPQVVARTPKWFWAAAAVLLAVNVVAAFRGSEGKASGGNGLKSVGSYYFQGGSDWFSQSE